MHIGLQCKLNYNYISIDTKSVKLNTIHRRNKVITDNSNFA